MYKSSRQEFWCNNISYNNNNNNNNNNSNNNNNNVVISISRHIEKLGIIRIVYSGIFRYIQEYSARLSHVQTYSELCVTLHIQPLSVSVPVTRHIQNPVLGHYSAIFRHIQNLVQRLHVQKPDVLKYWNIQNPYIIASRRILRSLSYLQKFTNI